MKIKKLLLASALLFSAYNVSAQTQVIAHRGFWKTEGSAQNSIAALIKADAMVRSLMYGWQPMTS